MFRPLMTVYFGCPSRSYATNAGFPKVKRASTLPWVFLTTVTGLTAASAIYWNPFADYEPKRLSSAYFTQLRIADVQAISPTTSILTLDVPAKLSPQDPLGPRPIQSIYIANSEMQVVRPYTPLALGSLFDDKTDTQLRILVKRYNDGETSQWLHRQAVGSFIGVRGPVPTWLYTKTPKSIVYIAGGTGVTPFLQLLDYLNALPIDLRPQVSLFHSSRAVDGIKIRSEIGKLADAYGPSCRLNYFTDAPGDGRATTGRLTIQDITKGIPDSADTLFLVSGPEKMVEEIAGSRLLARQGRVGGILGTLKLPPDNVVRL